MFEKKFNDLIANNYRVITKIFTRKFNCNEFHVKFLFHFFFAYFNFEEFEIAKVLHRKKFGSKFFEKNMVTTKSDGFSSGRKFFHSKKKKEETSLVQSFQYI